MSISEICKELKHIASIVEDTPGVNINLIVPLIEVAAQELRKMDVKPHGKFTVIQGGLAR
jgi:hypothetical protein